VNEDENNDGASPPISLPWNHVNENECDLDIMVVFLASMDCGQESEGIGMSISDEVASQIDIEGHGGFLLTI
jgi:hypothetical protein